MKKLIHIILVLAACKKPDFNVKELPVIDNSKKIIQYDSTSFQYHLTSTSLLNPYGQDNQINFVELDIDSNTVNGSYYLECFPITMSDSLFNVDFYIFGNSLLFFKPNITFNKNIVFTIDYKTNYYTPYILGTTGYKPYLVDFDINNIQTSLENPANWHEISLPLYTHWTNRVFKFELPDFSHVICIAKPK